MKKIKTCQFCGSSRHSILEQTTKVLTKMVVECDECRLIWTEKIVTDDSDNYIHKYLLLSKERKEEVNAVIDAMLKLR